MHASSHYPHQVSIVYMYQTSAAFILLLHADNLSSMCKLWWMYLQIKDCWSRKNVFGGACMGCEFRVLSWVFLPMYSAQVLLSLPLPC